MDDSLNTKDPLPDWVYQEAARRRPGPESPQPTEIQLYRLGDGRVAQVHCIQKVPKDLVPTMALHRAALLQSHPIDNLEQYVIIVGDGTVRGHEDPVHTGCSFDLKLLYVKDVEPEWFLLAPAFTRLSRSRTAPGVAQILESAEAELETLVLPPNPSEDRSHEMDENRAGLPDRLVSLFFAGRFGPPPDLPGAAPDADWAAPLNTALALYAITRFEEVRRRIGRRAGIADVLGDVLRERFGEHTDLAALAYRLAGSSDLDAVIQIITTAVTFDDLCSKYGSD